jgi:hypothetical protein
MEQGGFSRSRIFVVAAVRGLAQGGHVREKQNVFDDLLARPKC